MKFIAAINATLNLPGADPFDDGWHAFEKVILRFLAFEAAIQAVSDFAQAFSKSALGFERDLVTHEDANAIHFLPPFFQAEQRADLEITRRNINRARQITPV